MLLLDTNVISELRKVNHRQTNPHFQSWAKKLRWADLYLSAITLYELQVGISQLEVYDSVQADIIRSWLYDQVLERFASRTITITPEVALTAAKLQVPRTRTVEDSLLAATALVHRMKIVTRNVNHFEGWDVDVINPWDTL